MIATVWWNVRITINYRLDKSGGALVSQVNAMEPRQGLWWEWRRHADEEVVVVAMDSLRDGVVNLCLILLCGRKARSDAPCSPSNAMEPQQNYFCYGIGGGTLMRLRRCSRFNPFVVLVFGADIEGGKFLVVYCGLHSKFPSPLPCHRCRLRR